MEYILAVVLFGPAVGMAVVVRGLALSAARTLLLPQWLVRLGPMIALLGMLMVLGPMWNGFWVLGALGYCLSIVWILSLAPALWLPRQKRSETFASSTKA